MGDRVRSPCKQISGIDQHRERAGLCRFFCILEEVWLHTPTKWGFQRVPLWHTTLLAKCSVLYLLSRLLGKMRVSPDGNTHFARQENGQVFADGDGQKTGWSREWQRVYKIFIFLNTLDLILFLSAK